MVSGFGDMAAMRYIPVKWPASPAEVDIPGRGRHVRGSTSTGKVDLVAGA